MSEKPNTIPEKIHGVVKFLMGVKPRRDPRKEENPIFANFQDRLFASAIDVSVILLLFQDFYNWVYTILMNRVDDSVFVQPTQDQINSFTGTDEWRFVVDQMFESGFAQMWALNTTLQCSFTALLLLILWMHFHCTPGKFIVGIRLAGENGEGEPTKTQYIKRYFGLFLSMPIFMIGFALLGFDKQKRAWHDRIAGTTVVYTKEGNIFRRAWDLLKAKLWKKK